MYIQTEYILWYTRYVVYYSKILVLVLSYFGMIFQKKIPSETWIVISDFWNILCTVPKWEPYTDFRTLTNPQ